MHVDVDGLRSHHNADHAEAVASSRNQSSVRLVDGGEERAVVHSTAIDDEDHSVSRGAMRVWRGDRAADADSAGGLDVEQVSLGTCSDRASNGVAQRSAGGAGGEGPVVPAGEGDF